MRYQIVSVKPPEMKLFYALPPLSSRDMLDSLHELLRATALSEFLKDSSHAKAATARHERRVKHWVKSCRFNGCDNPKPAPVKVVGSNTKSRRPGAKPLFCRSHRWVQGMLSTANVRKLQADEKSRVVIG